MEHNTSITDAKLGTCKRSVGLAFPHHNIQHKNDALLKSSGLEWQELDISLRQIRKTIKIFENLYGNQKRKTGLSHCRVNK